MSKVTKQHFETFKKYCQYWRNEFGLTNFEVFYEHTNLDNAYGQTFWKLSGGVATTRLCKNWDDMKPINDAALKRLALHEMLHLVTAPLAAEAEDRFTNQTAIDIAEHSIVRRIENYLCKEPV